MFPVTADEYSGGSLEWERLVMVTDDAGFRATPNGGSNWTSRNKTLPRRIVFHRPHSESKVSQAMLQTLRGRMGRRFGWERDICACVKRDGDDLGECASVFLLGNEGRLDVDLRYEFPILLGEAFGWKLRQTGIVRL